MDSNPASESEPIVSMDADDLGNPEGDTVYPIATKRFDPARSRETTRGRLAAMSFILFAAMVITLTAAVVGGWRSWAELEGLATSLLPVVVSIVGTTTAFYFATKEPVAR